MLKKCDPPAEATSLAQFVRNEAGAELAAIRAAYEPLAKAHGAAAVCPAMEGFAAAVQRFHERARRRLLAGEVVAYGRLPGAWSEYVEIPPHGWRWLIWGDIGDYDGVAGIVKAQNWRPSEPDSWAVGCAELPGRPGRRNRPRVDGGAGARRCGERRLPPPSRRGRFARSWVVICATAGAAFRMPRG